MTGRLGSNKDYQIAAGASAQPVCHHDISRAAAPSIHMTLLLQGSSEDESVHTQFSRQFCHAWAWQWSKPLLQAYQIPGSCHPTKQVMPAAVRRTCTSLVGRKQAAALCGLLCAAAEELLHTTKEQSDGSIGYLMADFWCLLQRAGHIYPCSRQGSGEDRPVHSHSSRDICACCATLWPGCEALHRHWRWCS